MRKRAAIGPKFQLCRDVPPKEKPLRNCFSISLRQLRDAFPQSERSYLIRMSFLSNLISSVSSAVPEESCGVLLVYIDAHRTEFQAQSHEHFQVQCLRASCGN